MAFLPKLTPEQREEIKVRINNGEVLARIAFDYNVGVLTVQRIKAVMKQDAIPKEADPSDFSQVVCEDREQGYRDNLRWAIDAAGTYMRTKQHPETCPCNAALYLYRQAITEPKDFISKMGQMEVKREDTAKTDARRELKRTIREIDEMLAQIEETNEANSEYQSQ